MHLPKINSFEWEFRNTLDFSQTHAWQINIVLSKFERLYNGIRFNLGFWREFYKLEQRPTPLVFAKSLSQEFDAKVYLKRDDLTSSKNYKIYNILAQMAMAKKINKKRIVFQANSLSYAISAIKAASIFEFEFDLFAQSEILSKIDPEIIKKAKGEAFTTQDNDIIKKWPIEAVLHWLGNENTHFYIVDSLNMPNPYLSIANDTASIFGQELRKQIFAYENKDLDLFVVNVDHDNNGYELFNNFIFDDIKLAATSLKEEKKTKAYYAPNFTISNKQNQKKESFDLIKKVEIEPSLAKKAQEILQSENIQTSLDSATTLAYLFDKDIKKDSIIILHIAQTKEPLLGLE